MATQQHDEREVRAGRNQALFRVLNERLTSLNAAFESVTRTFTIACECADGSCVEMIDIEPADYEAIRAEPRRFAVRPGHVLPDIEASVRETADYVVVEKHATAGKVAEAFADEVPAA